MPYIFVANKHRDSYSKHDYSYLYATLLGNVFVVSGRLMILEFPTQSRVCMVTCSAKPDFPL